MLQIGVRVIVFDFLRHSVELCLLFTRYGFNVGDWPLKTANIAKIKSRYKAILVPNECVFCYCHDDDDDILWSLKVYYPMKTLEILAPLKSMAKLPLVPMELEFHP